jgi:hypothetical protein
MRKAGWSGRTVVFLDRFERVPGAGRFDVRIAVLVDLSSLHQAGVVRSATGH